MTALNPTRSDLLQMFALDMRITRASGFRLFDDQGRQYLDFLSQYGAMPFGHNPEPLWEALDRARRSQTPTMLQPLRPLEAERLAERLAAITPGDLGITTFTNSGAETVEAALKLARIRTGRAVVLSTQNGFHGKTLGALSATGKPVYQEGFGAPAPDFGYVPFGDLAALEARLEAGADRIAAFIVEPIQGEGGVVCPPDDYLDAAIALCRRHGVLSIVDEIQTGLGRTGALFACARGREVPDMLLLSKALGGGMIPIGACIVRPSAWDERFGRLHSSTFAGNGLACAAANATLDMLLAEDGAMIAHVAREGAYLKSRLEALQTAYPEVIASVRGRGFMCGVEFHGFDGRDESATMAFASRNGAAVPLISSYLLNRQGLLTAPLFNSSHVLRLQPTLITGRAEIDEAMGALEAACDIIDRREYVDLVRHLADPARIVAPRVSAENPQPPAAGAAPEPVPGEFAFLIHYTEENDILRSDPSFARFSPEELATWRDWVRQVGPGQVRRLAKITSKTGASAEGWLMSVPLLPADMMGANRGPAASMIRDAVDMAAAQGSGRVGLGAFTSIATRGGELVTGRGVPVTSGNTLTTISAVQSIRDLARQTGINLATAHVVVVGASGAIGRLGALMLAREAGRISLVGNAKNPFTPKLLGRVANELCDALVGPAAAKGPRQGHLATRLREIAPRIGTVTGEGPASDLAERMVAALKIAGDDPPPFAWNLPLADALCDADIVLVATSSDRALIDPRLLPPGTLVCDVSRPPNVLDVRAPEGRVLAFDGGLIAPPFEVDLGAFQMLPRDRCWGCLGETMLLALAREPGDYSIGARLSLAQADRLADLARRHGFEPAAPHWYGRPVTATDLSDFARQRQHRDRWPQLVPHVLCHREG
ncbi:aminotransferase class III-fold pyridoxal phosphate-dependent enzyme [Frigidibacter sp. MR17.14]|uniref:aminotransferase class III-fold pyridoxal phosphate-dependent enzyme n=1 Tax=Frigidibacter sp. MR17.14 TaxID=3126509 RepID=UPI003012BCE3